jgi:anti-anti-sigma factor
VNFHIEDQSIDDSTHVIELGGEVDLYTAPEFKERMVELIESGKKQIVVDLSKATFIDSTTLGVLVGGVKRLRPTRTSPRSSRSPASTACSRSTRRATTRSQRSPQPSKAPPLHSRFRRAVSSIGRAGDS